MGLFEPVRLGQVRIGITSSIIQNTKAPFIHLPVLDENLEDRFSKGRLCPELEGGEEGVPI